MKLLLALTILAMNTTVAFADGANLKVLNAAYNAASDSIEIEIKHKGGCSDTYSTRLRGCTDAFFPYTCFLDVNVTQGEACSEEVHGVLSYSRAELGMTTRKFSNATIVVQNNKGKTRKSVQLPINR